MKWKSTLRILKSQIKRAARDSELLQQPAKKFADEFFGSIVPTLVALLWLLLLTPFTWRTATFDAVMLLLAIAACVIFLKSRTQGRFALTWWIVVSVAIITASISPFCVLPKPLYFAELGSYNPLAAKAYALKTAEKNIGSGLAVYNFDFVRKSIFV